MMIDVNTLAISCILSAILYLFLRKRPKVPVVADLIYYPVKSCAGIHLKTAELAEFGIKNDRVWSLMEGDKFVSQTKDPRLVRLQPSFRYSSAGEPSHLILSFIGFPEFSLELKPNNTHGQTFTLYGAKGSFIDEGDLAAEYLKSVFDRNYRLVRLVQGRKLREVEDMPKIDNDSQLSFASEGQVLFATVDSLAALKESLPYYIKNEVTLDCFRANVILKNVPAFSEDKWKTFKIGSTSFEFIKKCDRCRMTTLNHSSLNFDPNAEPLNTLRKCHGDGVKGYFGILCRHESSGTLKVGDSLAVTSKFP